MIIMKAGGRFKTGTPNLSPEGFTFAFHDIDIFISFGTFLIHNNFRVPSVIAAKQKLLMERESLSDSAA